MPELEDLEIRKIGLSFVVKGQRWFRVTFKELAKFLMNPAHKYNVYKLFGILF